MNGTYCPDILVDMGATQTLVHKSLVTDEDILDGEVKIRCAHGDTVAYPLAAIKITIDGKDIITTAAVSSTLPASALLGWDVPELITYLTGIRPEQDKMALATTRLQAHQPQPPQAGGAQTEDEALDVDLHQDQHPQETDIILSNVDDSLFSPVGTPGPVLTRSQKRENRRRYLSDRNSNDSEGPGLDISSEELRILQENDTSLSHARSVAD